MLVQALDVADNVHPKVRSVQKEHAALFGKQAYYIVTAGVAEKEN